MRFPVQVYMNGFVTFLIEAESKEDAKNRMSTVNRIDYAAEYCENDLGEDICLDNIDSSDFEIRIIK